MTYCHRGTKGRKGQNIIFRLAIIQRYCLCYCVLTIYFLKIALSLGASYGDKCVITSLLLEIPRKIFCDSEGWTEHACTGSRRAMVYTEPAGTCWGGGERLLLQGRDQSWVLSRGHAGCPARGLGRGARQSPVPSRSTAVPVQMVHWIFLGE